MAFIAPRRRRLGNNNWRTAARHRDRGGSRPFCGPCASHQANQEARPSTPAYTLFALRRLDSEELRREHLSQEHLRPANNKRRVGKRVNRRAARSTATWPI